MKEPTRIEAYWSDFFGVAGNTWSLSGCKVVPHRFLEGFHGVWIFKYRQLILISSPPELVAEIDAKTSARKNFCDTPFSEDSLEYLFGKQLNKVIGPVYQGYYIGSYDNTFPENVRQMELGKYRQQIAELANSGDPTGWEHGGIGVSQNDLYGYWENDKLLAAAAYKERPGKAGFIGVYTHPAFRGLGYGRAVVSAAIGDLTVKGYLILYQTLHSNTGAIGIANHLGIRHFATNIAVRLNLG